MNDVVLSEIKFTSAAIDDNFRLNPTHYNVVTLIAFDTVYIYYRFEELKERGVIYVTTMKKNIIYQVLSVVMYNELLRLMEYRFQVIELKKRT